MQMPVQKTRVVAATPIVAGEQRLLPSVLVTTVEGGDARASLFRFVKARPISVVIEGPEGARWLEIPNATGHVLSTMAAVGAGVAVVSVLLIGLARLVRGS